MEKDIIVSIGSMTNQNVDVEKLIILINEIRNAHYVKLPTFFKYFISTDGNIIFGNILFFVSSLLGIAFIVSVILEYFYCKLIDIPVLDGKVIIRHQKGNFLNCIENKDDVKIIMIESCKIKDFSVFGKFKNLIDLTFNYCNIDNDDVKNLVNAVQKNKLKYISIFNNGNVFFDLSNFNDFMKDSENKIIIESNKYYWGYKYNMIQSESEIFEKNNFLTSNLLST